MTLDGEKTTAGMLREFHRVFAGHNVKTVRGKLLAEECAEALEALKSGDRAAIARELADLVYLAYGSALAYDIDLDAALTEVHRANMSKLGADGRPILREDGKVLKGPGYTPPDMGPALPSTAFLHPLTGHLAKGDPIEVAWITLAGETTVEHGRFDFVGVLPHGAETLYYTHQGAVRGVERDKLCYVKRVDPMLLAASYWPGERVVVHRYGSDHTGRVVHVAKTRLTVEIVLGEGTTRQRKRNVIVPALDVRRAS